MTKEQIEIIKKEYHLDGNIVEQYLTWAGHVLRGDFGTSISQNRPVAQMIGERLPATPPSDGNITLDFFGGSDSSDCGQE